MRDSAYWDFTYEIDPFSLKICLMKEGQEVEARKYV